jgi:hypothetical protein
VRFSTDSIFERIAHACHFGVMVGLAVIAPQFGDQQEVPWQALQILSLLFTVNRFVLGLQYCSTLYFVWRFPSCRMPFIITAASLFLTSAIFLGISFDFYTTHENKAFAAWYFLSVFECLVSVQTAHKWDVVSFRNTYLIERMSCLTLIILGEGVIGLARSIVKTTTLGYVFSSAAIGSIIAAVLIIYLIYMLYFDNVPEDFNELRLRGAWTFLHIPFHIALVLVMEGMSQVLVWRQIVDYLNVLFAPILNDLAISAPQEEFYQSWNETVSTVIETFDIDADSQNTLQDALQYLVPNSNYTYDQMSDAANTAQATIFQVVFDGYGFTSPDPVSLAGFPESLSTYSEVFQLVFVYWFVSAGLLLVILSLMAFLRILDEECTEDRAINVSGGIFKGMFKYHKTLFDIVKSRPRRFVGILAELLLGIGLALLSLIVLTSSLTNLAYGSWILVIVALTLLATVALRSIPRGFVLIGPPIPMPHEDIQVSSHEEKKRRPTRVGTGF